MTTYHVCISIDYILNRGGAREMSGLVKIDGEEADEALILTTATIMQAKGYVVLPSCCRHDANGYCLGHETESP